MGLTEEESKELEELRELQADHTRWMSTQESSRLNTLTYKLYDNT